MVINAHIEINSHERIKKTRVIKLLIHMFRHQLIVAVRKRFMTTELDELCILRVDHYVCHFVRTVCPPVRLARDVIPSVPRNLEESLRIASHRIFLYLVALSFHFSLDENTPKEVMVHPWMILCSFRTPFTPL